MNRVASRTIIQYAQADYRVVMKKWLVFVGKKEEEAKRHGGGIPQLHVGGTIACKAAADRSQRERGTGATGGGS